jgi:hypothetical protein
MGMGSKNCGVFNVALLGRRAVESSDLLKSPERMSLADYLWLEWTQPDTDVLILNRLRNPGLDPQIKK